MTAGAGAGPTGEGLLRDNPGPLDRAAVRRRFERIIDESRRLERLAAEGDIGDD